MTERREFFTADGSYVLLQPAGLGRTYDQVNGVGEVVNQLEHDNALRFACTAGDNDLGAQLEEHELLELGLWLLDQVMDEWEHAQVHRLLQLTRRRLQLDPEPMPDYDEQGRAQLDPDVDPF